MLITENDSMNVTTAQHSATSSIIDSMYEILEDSVKKGEGILKVNVNTIIWGSYASKVFLLRSVQSAYKVTDLTKCLWGQYIVYL